MPLKVSSCMGYTEDMFLEYTTASRMFIVLLVSEAEAINYVGWEYHLVKVKILKPLIKIRSIITLHQDRETEWLRDKNYIVVKCCKLIPLY